MNLLNLVLVIAFMWGCDNNVKNIDRNSGRIADEMEKTFDPLKEALGNMDQSLEDYKAILNFALQAYIEQNASKDSNSSSSEPDLSPLPKQNPPRDEYDFLGPMNNQEQLIANLPVTIEGSKCIDVDFEKAKQSLIDYSGHHVIDDQAKNDMPGIRFMDMTESLDWELDFNELTQKSHVYYVMTPINVKDPERKPRFHVHCLVNQRDTRRFAQKCDLINVDERAIPGLEFTNYGLSEFNQLTILYPNHPSCQNNVGLYYKIILNSNPAHLNEIKKAIAQNNAALKRIIDFVFDEKKFFSSYYQKYIDAWIKSLR